LENGHTWLELNALSEIVAAVHIKVVKREVCIDASRRPLEAVVCIISAGIVVRVKELELQHQP
jgi:hypothetical protein